jgi:hypothetical protein
LIGRTKSWLAWLAGAALALVFGGAGCGQGHSPACKYGPPPSPPPPVNPPTVHPAGSLEASAEWGVVLATFKSDEDRTIHPSAKRDIYGQALAATAKLADRGLLSPQEAELLNMEIKARERAFLIATTCYSGMEAPAQQKSFRSLSARLPLLEKMVAGGRIQRAAAEKILATVETDLATLSDEKNLALLGVQRAAAEKTRDEVKAAVEKLKAQMAGTAKEH